MNRIDQVKKLIDDAFRKAEEQVKWNREAEKEKRARLLMMDCEFNDVPSEMFKRIFRP